MANGSSYEREKNGMRLDFKGINVSDPIDVLPPYKYPYAENIRRYIQGGIQGRTLETAPLFAAAADPVHSLRRMNDTTPAGPGSGYVIISGAGTKLYANNTQVKTGLSGQRIAIVPFRPNTSVQPWAYIGDDNLMVKVRSDGTTWKTGIKEPQLPPAATGSSGGSSTITYRYTYRSGATGAVSNPSPISNSVTNGSANAQVGAGVTNPAQYRINLAQWEVVASQFRTIDSWSDSRLLDPIYTQNMTVVSGTFPVPDKVSITGIVFDLQWLNQAGQLPGTLVNCQLSYQGGLIGTQKLPGINSNGFITDTLIGGSGDLWGAALTPEIVNDPSFGVEFQIYTQNGNRVFIDVCYVTIYWAVQNESIQATGSTDPQVDLIDYWRQGGALTDYTYVGTGPNGSPPAAFVDTLNDAVALVNPILSTSNYEPFPSIDLPRSGTGTASGGVLTWTGGDHFNVRWLPGTVMLVGGPSGVAYVLDRRPTDTTHMYVLGLPNGTGLTWSIAQPLLAQQCMRSMWGPTDNVSFMFAVGDPLRPGTLYFTAGNNPDSAPDTNSIEVTSPSEPLMGGTIVAGISLVGSTERFWLAYPNFFNALADVTGTVGSPFTMVLSIANRGLYAKKGICSDGGANAFFVGKDGIYKSPGGRGSASITDADLYPLFPHEGEIQADITVGSTGVTLYAPDFTKPNAMSLSYANGFLYFDYQDANSNPRTLVYDDFAQGWVVDVYQYPAIAHALEEGPVEGVMVGCTDGSIRQLSSAGTENASAKVLLPAFNAGDARAEKQWGDIYLDAQLASVVAHVYTGLYGTSLLSSTITGGAGRSQHVIDLGSGGTYNVLAPDLEASLSWAFGPPLGSPTILYVWQPNLIEKPEKVQNRPTDYDDAGTPGVKFLQGFILEADTYNVSKAIQVQDSDTLSLHTPNESPFTLNGQSVKAFSLTPPVLAHSMRIVSSDSVAWRQFGVRWMFQPYPELALDWQSEFMSHGLLGWQHVFMLNVPHISTADLTLTMKFDAWPDIHVTIPNSGGTFQKTKVTIPSNKFKLASYRISSTAAFRLFEPMFEAWIRAWGETSPYRIVLPYKTTAPLGGPANAGALV